MLKCRERDCLGKCDLCGRILIPGEDCACGGAKYVSVPRGELEEFMISSMNNGAFEVLPKKFYSGYWLVFVYTKGEPADRDATILYRSERREEPQVIEKVLDEIQVSYILNSNFIQQVLKEYRPNGGGIHGYKVSVFLHERIREIAKRSSTSMLNLVSSFLNYVKEGGK